MPVSIYLHIPFCVQKCRYCDFNSVAVAPFSLEEYTDLLIKEMSLRSAMLDAPVTATTLYLGGGTPSLLAPELVARLVEAAVRRFHLTADAEVTLEANPGTVTAATLGGYRSAGVNRLSLGVQSLDDRFLAILGRVHTAAEARQAVALARRAGFDNLGIDLIHSLPGQTLGQWQNTLREAVALGPEHVSAYGLSIEEGTPFAASLVRGELELPDEEESVRMIETSRDTLAVAGFEPYEIANFARPGWRSRHNQVYWRRGSYLGFGAGAHSFLAGGWGVRWHNPPELTAYRDTIVAGFPAELDRAALTEEEARSEFMFLGLRLLEGVSDVAFCAAFGLGLAEAWPTEIDAQIAAGLLERDGDRLRLTRQGLLLANRVFAAFV
ncbi:radical SAM family heme chaperone HemW [Geobacter argillaceus]|uniref:Heme chaperone HemW n=1 Tax=Geobacter argillaceus TaxID=345631 RepID=A0A562VND4_9BACT|nr:radical SAM family heme chaperone HemW [Geobacter argillaceus]TWJ19496.1 coproporphyrinogen III oxidase, anaerobic [Geobacter argillaceus]